MDQADRDTHASADIIAFPRAPSPPAAPVIRPETTDQASARLQRAIAELDAALITQRMAVQSWKRAIGDLQGTVHGLGTSLRDYNAVLDGVGTRISALSGEAKRLETWSAGTLANPEP